MSIIQGFGVFDDFLWVNKWFWEDIFEFEDLCVVIKFISKCLWIWEFFEIYFKDVNDEVEIDIDVEYGIDVEYEVDVEYEIVVKNDMNVDFVVNVECGVNVENNIDFNLECENVFFYLVVFENYEVKFVILFYM